MRQLNVSGRGEPDTSTHLCTGVVGVPGCVAPSGIVPAGTAQACIFWSATNIPNGTQYQVFWRVNDQSYDAQPNGHWLGSTLQVNWCRPADASGLPSGHHSFTFWAGGQPRFNVQFDIG